MIDLSLSDQELDRMLEQNKKNVFLGNNAAFLGSMLCSTDFSWDRSPGFINKVGTTGECIRWGIQDFLECTPKERDSTLLHELWHDARLHHLRRGSRDHKIWNDACDYRINNDLRADGFEIPNNWLVNPDIDANGILAEEEIYDLLISNKIPPPPWGQQSMQDLPEDPVSPAQANQMLASAVRAMQAAVMSGQAGSLPGGMKEILNSFLDPVIPWRNVLAQWMTELLESTQFTWKRPNRRFQNMGIYLPSQEQEEGKLDHLTYFMDVSGSISNKDAVRFNSEVKYIQEVLQPRKLTLIQFDEVIQSVIELKEGDPFTEIEIIGRGGTSLYPVWKWIEEHKPTAAIVLSDLECAPMRPLTVEIPIIWAVIRTKQVQVPFGTVIYIKD